MFIIATCSRDSLIPLSQIFNVTILQKMLTAVHMSSPKSLHLVNAYSYMPPLCSKNKGNRVGFAFDLWERLFTVEKVTFRCQKYTKNSRKVRLRIWALNWIPDPQFIASKFPFTTFGGSHCSTCVNFGFSQTPLKSRYWELRLTNSLLVSWSHWLP